MNNLKRLHYAKRAESSYMHLKIFTPLSISSELFHLFPIIGSQNDEHNGVLWSLDERYADKPDDTNKGLALNQLLTGATATGGVAFTGSSTSHCFQRS